MTLPETFLDDVARQTERYRTMTALGEEMIAGIVEDRLNDVLPLMERKRRLMEEIQELEKRVSPLRKRWTEIKAALSPEMEKKASQVLLDARAAIEALVAVENRAGALLERGRAAASSQLDDLIRKRKAGDAYGGDPK
jgi:predicted  nucleic acid-binding Zn-ribbon protein